ncbi:MAG: HEAT repeat domain-containing protein [Isosphaeraceae bacterium]
MLVGRLGGVLLLVVAFGPSTALVAAQDEAGTLAGDLKAKDLDVRRGAANRIRNSGREVQRDALPALIDVLMKEKDGQVRLAALDAVASLGPDAASAVPALVHTLRTNSGGQRLEELHQDYRSALALAAIGKPAVEGLTGLLKEKPENVRAEVVMALGRIGPDASSAVADLIPLLGDSSERIRREASLALGRIGPAATGPLTAAAAQRDAIPRAAAIEGLGHVAATDDRVRRVIVSAAEDAAPEVRAAAVNALERLGLHDESLEPTLRKAIRDRDGHVRRAAIAHLAARRPLLARIAPELESLLSDEREEVARDAAFLLGEIGPDAVPRLLAALRREASRISLIAEALAQIGRPAVGALTTAVGDSDPRVRRGTALALGQIRPLAPGVVATLSTGLHDPDPEVKGAFLTAVGELGPRANEAAPAVHELLKDRSPAVRMQAVEVLTRAAPRDQRLRDDLVPLLDDVDVQVQRRTIDAIRILGPTGRAAQAAIVEKLGKSKDREVRLAALQFIASHGPFAESAVPAVTSLLGDPSPQLRTAAARTLGQMGKAAEPALGSLTELLKDEQVEVRESVATTVGSLGLDARTIRPALSRAILDDQPAVRRAALSAVFRLGPDGAIFVPDLILLAARDKSPGQARRMLRRFERNGPDARSVPELIKQLEHDQESVRLLAVKFLGLAGANASDAIPALARLRDDPSAEVRKAVDAAQEQIRKAGAPSTR